MRLVRSLAAAALFASASVAAQPMQASLSSSGPVATQALGPGEILLELSAYGIGQATPGTVKFTVRIRAESDTRAAAEAQHAAIVRRVRAAARAAGVADGDIVPSGDDAL